MHKYFITKVNNYLPLCKFILAALFFFALAITVAAMWSVE